MRVSGVPGLNPCPHWGPRVWRTGTDTLTLTLSQGERGNGTAGSTHPARRNARAVVGGELNKLAGNIALFRSAAGVHWRTDYCESLLLGERVAIGFLRELSLTFNEDDAFFQFTRFDGTRVRIFDGCVEPG